MKKILILSFSFFFACGAPSRDDAPGTVSENSVAFSFLPTLPQPAAAPPENDTLEDPKRKSPKVVRKPRLANPNTPKIPSLAYLTGRFDPAKNLDFINVAPRYTDGDLYFLYWETYASFEKMHARALADGVKLVVVSATRNFKRQKQIWEAKWNGKRLLEGKKKANKVYPDPADRARAILRFSSMPGTSRHHWGTDIDLNDLENSYFTEGEGKKVYDWLMANASTYGFCQPYTKSGEARPNGYEERKWHWSYLPIATQLSDYAVANLKDTDISGFAGAEAAPQIGVLENYILGINMACKK